MKENSIEETKKQLELILKVRKEQKEIIECAGGSCINCDPDIKALSESIDILSDYKRLQKENEDLKADNYELDNRITDLLENIPIQKVKDKIEEEKLPLTIVGGRKNKKTLEYGIKLGRRQALQELIEERE